MSEMMTYEEIGRQMGISTQRARQICENALRKIRQQHPKELRRLHALAQEKQLLRSRKW